MTSIKPFPCCFPAIAWVEGASVRLGSHTQTRFFNTIKLDPYQHIHLNNVEGYSEHG